MAKKKVDQLKSAEEKFQTLIDKRNQLNDKAFTIRDERNVLNDKKKEMISELEKHREKRRALSKKVGEKKAERDELQKKAKSMIEVKRKLRSNLRKDADMDLDSTKQTVTKLEMEQQTTPLTLEKEAELLKKIRNLYKRIEELQDIAVDQADTRVSLEEIDQAIDEAFQLANSEHQGMLVFVEERRMLDDEIKALVNEIGVVAASANKKHEEFIKIRTAADQYHGKASELRDKILEIRSAKRKEREEQRNAIEEQNKSVKRELLDEKKLEEAADSALEKLLSSKKIEL